MPTAVSRRHLVAATAWSAPVILLGQPAAAASCSTVPTVSVVPTLGIASSIQTKTVNGHTIGTFSYTMGNQGTTSIPAGTTYTVLFQVTKAPGNAGKNLTVTPRTVSGLALSQTAALSMNPDGQPKGVVSFAVTVTLTSPLAPAATRAQVWDIDSETGVGATHLTMTATLAGYGGSECVGTGTGGEITDTGQWGSAV